MFESLFRQPIELILRDQQLRFDSEADFAFALEGRTDVPGEETARLLAASNEEISDEMTRGEADLVELRGHFEDALDAPQRLSERLRDIPKDRWRCEHQWDELLGAIADMPSPVHAVQRCAVLAYLQYLRSRIDLAGALLRSRNGGDVDDNARATQTATAAAVGFDSVDDDDEQLPRGQATLVLDSDVTSTWVRFSQYRHRIVRTPGTVLQPGAVVELVDEGGKRWLVDKGTNCVGRDHSCDITLRSVLKDISRAHAVLNHDDDGRIWLTDTSSRGTFIVKNGPGEGSIDE